jgi:catalase
LPDGQAAVSALLADGHALEFLKDQYRHCKTILVLGASSHLLQKADISPKLPSGKMDPGLMLVDGNSSASAVDSFVKAVGLRHFVRETDPPSV